MDIRKQVVVNVRTDGEGLAEKLALEFQAAQQKMAALQNAIVTGNTTVAEATTEFKSLLGQMGFLEKQLSSVREEVARADPEWERYQDRLRAMAQEAANTAGATEEKSRREVAAGLNAIKNTIEQIRAKEKLEEAERRVAAAAIDASMKGVEASRRAVEAANDKVNRILDAEARLVARRDELALQSNVKELERQAQILSDYEQFEAKRVAAAEAAAAKLQARMTEYFAAQKRENDGVSQANLQAARDTSNAWGDAYAKMGMEQSKADAKAARQAEVAAQQWLEEQRKAQEKATQIADAEAAKRQQILDRWNTKIHNDEIARLQREADETQRKNDAAIKSGNQVLASTTIQDNELQKLIQSEIEDAAAKRQQANAAAGVTREQGHLNDVIKDGVDDMHNADTVARDTSRNRTKLTNEETEAQAQRYRGLNATIRNVGYGISDVFANNGPIGQKIQGFANNVSFMVAGALQTLNKLTPTGLAAAAGIEIAFTALGATLTSFGVKSLADIKNLLEGHRKEIAGSIDDIERRMKELSDKPVKLAIDTVELKSLEDRLDKFRKGLKDYEDSQNAKTTPESKAGEMVSGALNAQSGLERLIAAQLKGRLVSEGEATNNELAEAKKAYAKIKEEADRAADMRGPRGEFERYRLQGKLEEASDRIHRTRQAIAESAQSEAGNIISGAKAGNSGADRERLAGALDKMGHRGIAEQVRQATPENIEAAEESKRNDEIKEEQAKQERDRLEKLKEEGQKHHQMLEKMFEDEAKDAKTAAKAAAKVRLKGGKDFDSEVASHASRLGSSLDDTLTKKAVGMKSDGQDNDAIRAALGSDVYKKIQSAGVGGDIADADTKDKFLSEITNAIMKKFMTDFAGKIVAKAMDLPPLPAAAPLLGGKKPKGRKARLAYEERQRRKAKSPEQRAAEAMSEEMQEKEHRKAEADQAHQDKHSRANTNAQIAAGMQRDFGLNEDQAALVAPKVGAMMKQGMNQQDAGRQAVLMLQEHFRKAQEAEIHNQANWEAMMGVIGPATIALSQQHAFNAMMGHRINALGRGAQGGMFPAFPPN